MVEVHHRLNVQYIGRVLQSPFYLWTNIRPTKLADLKVTRTAVTDAGVAKLQQKLPNTKIQLKYVEGQ